MTTGLFDKRDPEVLAKARNLLSQFRQDEVQSIQQAAGRLDREAATSHLDYLLRFSQLEAAVAEQHPPLKPAPTYHVGTLFLRECFQYLTQGAPEAAHYVSGIRDGDTFTLDRMVTFKYAKQSVAGVEGDPADTAKALILIDTFGHQLHGWFHSHPEMGPMSYMPSGTDMKHQARLESGGYPAIGAVFARDGHVKFFSDKRQFKVAIYGEGVQKIDETLYRITRDSSEHKGR